MVSGNPKKLQTIGSSSATNRRNNFKSQTVKSMMMKTPTESSKGMIRKSEEKKP